MRAAVKCSGSCWMGKMSPVDRTVKGLVRGCLGGLSLVTESSKISQETGYFITRVRKFVLQLSLEELRVLQSFVNKMSFKTPVCKNML